MNLYFCPKCHANYEITQWNSRQGCCRSCSRSKYRAEKTAVDGHTFASKKEAARYRELLLLQRAGEVHSLEIQPEYKITVNDEPICEYIGDFRYTDVATGQMVVEDVKSDATKTRLSQLKMKLMKAVHKVEVRIIN